MRTRTPTLKRAAIAAVTLTTALLVGGAVAHAQYVEDPLYVADPYVSATYVDELVVTGPIGRDGPQSLSRRVSYADLDLTTYAGREVLKLRVRDTARDLCRLLGEDRFASGPLTRSCETEAVREARKQVKRAVNVAYARYDRTYYAAADIRPW